MLARHGDTLLTVCREFECRQNVFFCQFGEVLQNFLDRHTGCEVAKNVFNRDAHMPDARLAGSFTRFDSNDLLVDIHKTALCKGTILQLMSNFFPDIDRAEVSSFLHCPATQRPPKYRASPALSKKTAANLENRPTVPILHSTKAGGRTHEK